MSPESIQQFGYSNLGPIFHRYLTKLRIAQLAVSSEKPCTLYLARGGLRLRYFNELLSQEQPLAAEQQNAGDFFVSRVSVLRAALASRSEYAIEQISKLYSGKSFIVTVLLLTKPDVFRKWHEGISDEQLLDYSSQKPSVELFKLIFEGHHANDNLIVEYFKEQRELLVQHLNQVAGDSNKILLVDTGWSGSISATLSEIFPEREFVSVFFGKFSYFGNVTGPYMQDLLGLEIEGDGYIPWKPTTSLLLNRHLIEAICEVNFPSVSYYEQDEHGKVVFDPRYFDQSLRAPSAHEFLALGIKEYLLANSALSPATVVFNANRAYKKLARFSLFPSRDKVELGRFARSIDLGQKGSTDIVTIDGEKLSFVNKVRRLRKSLWVPGQIAVEFSYLRLPLQLAYAGFCFLKTIRLRFR